MALVVCFIHRAPTSTFDGGPQVTAILDGPWDPALLPKNPFLDTAEVVWEILGHGNVIWRRCVFELRPSNIEPYVDAIDVFTQRIGRRG